MNLSPVLQAKLDPPLKAFEVALRCYVADKLLKEYPTEAALKNELQRRVDSVTGQEYYFSGKINSAKALLKHDKWPSFWENICFIEDCFQKKRHYKSHNVTDLNHTILMIYVFQQLFRDLSNAFERPETFASCMASFHSVRNHLSHQGSYLISQEEAHRCADFILTAGVVIDNEYFWFQPYNEIVEGIHSFTTALENPPAVTGNLDRIPFPNNRIVCREPELIDLFKYVCSWDGSRKLRNHKHLVCVSGYGGVGKTSLVTEFISRLLDALDKENYHGFRPSFIQFYSAKKEILEYTNTSGDLYVKGMRPQFSTYSSFLSCLYKDLNIKEFDDEWSRPGILIIDNLETLMPEDRTAMINFINYEVPPEIHVIITTRIPEHADEQIQLKGFQNEAGIRFIDEYIQENCLNLVLSGEQKRDMIRYSYGNSLVLVLGIMRLNSKVVSYRSIIDEMMRLPKNTQDNSISQFMFQNTINELLKIYPAYDNTIRSVLTCLTVSSGPLTAEILAIAHRRTSASVEEIEDVLHLLADYLVVERIGDSYSINEFANTFVLVSLSPSPTISRDWRTRITSAINEVSRQKNTVAEYKYDCPDLSNVLDEWMGQNETESLAICKAFSIYDQKQGITRGNAEYEIESINREFDEIERRYHTHPYIYYQRARILKELRQDGIIDDNHNDQIKDNYERCLMMIDSPSFNRIKQTKTYPSVLWIYSMFLLSIQNYSAASHCADTAVQNYTILGISNDDALDALAVYGLSESKLFSPQERNVTHLKNARAVQKKLKKFKQFPILQDHKKALDAELKKYEIFKV